MNKTDNYFLLFSNCIPVKGAQRSVICDLQRSRYKLIPNMLYEALLDLQIKSIKEVIYDSKTNIEEGLNSYLNLLVEDDWGMLTKEPKRFPKLNLEWDSPMKITNAIIDISHSSDYSIKDTFSQLEELGCEAVQIRCFDKFTLDTLNIIHDSTIISSITFIELLIPFSSSPDLNSRIQELLRINMRFKSIVFHSSPKNDIESIELGQTHLSFINHLTAVIDSNEHCGMVDKSLFTVNIPSFTEAIHFNSCLNRKISICENGEIKNCPSMVKSFGNIKNVKLIDVLIDKNFSESWTINKDQIEICKDCEFRYICTDCRAFLVDSKNKFSKPVKCKYDPYTASWNS
jgi:SPASM domain peptide maturase of grasp-with-spasm system